MQLTCRRQLLSKSFEKIVTSVANCEEPLYAIIMSRKSFRVDLHSIFCLNVKELLTESIRKNQVIYKSFTNMSKLWLLYKVNLRILLKIQCMEFYILKVNPLLSAYVTETQRCLATQFFRNCGQILEKYLRKN